MEASLPPLTRFILPAGSTAAAGLHWARAVSRRAASLAVEALSGDNTSGENASGENASGENTAGDKAAGERGSDNSDWGSLLAWSNRLSDALFVLARRANQLDGIVDVPWESQSRGGSQTTGP